VSFFDLFAQPQHIQVQTDGGTLRLEFAPSAGLWQADGLQVAVQPNDDHSVVRVLLSAPGQAVRRVHLRWQATIPEEARYLGDHWERGYGDLEWRGLVPERKLPWYFLAHDGQVTCGYGVETGAGSLAWWQVDGAGVHLWLDVSNGGRGVLLGDRVLECADLLMWRGDPGETPFAVAQAFCKRLAFEPRLPSHPVHGGNNWYYAYGKSSHEAFLRDTDLLVENCPDPTNRPYSVIDDCWQAGRLTPATVTQQSGPWDHGNANFPDMPGLAAAIRDRGARPGIWIRPLGAAPGTPENRLLSAKRILNGANQNVPALDPSIPENLAQVEADIRRLREWGYDLIKHDWTTCDILGRWGFDMDAAFTSGDWAFADRSRTTAEIIRDLYAAIRRGAGEGPNGAVLIGCNTVGHLGVGLFELQRTGDDTSGREWDRTRKMGVNTLAFRMAQHNAFFAVDADCVGLTNQIPWHLNRQWLDVLARSGTPLFVSADPAAVGPEQKAALKEAFALAARPQPVAEPLDWLDTICPRRWRFGSGETATYDWYDGANE
jgi:alpha-galactosidase